MFLSLEQRPDFVGSDYGALLMRPIKPHHLDFRGALPLSAFDQSSSAS